MAALSGKADRVAINLHDVIPTQVSQEAGDQRVRPQELLEDGGAPTGGQEKNGEILRALLLKGDGNE